MILRDLFFMFCCLTPICALCQIQENVSVSIIRTKESNDSLALYNVQINNDTDSILCIPHSIYFDLRETVDLPKGLAVYKSSNETSFYNLIYAFGDTTIDPQFYPTSANFLLPHQKLEFEISLRKSNKKKCLVFKYVQLFDLCYRSFLHEMQGHWLRKYTVIEKQVLFE